MNTSRQSSGPGRRCRPGNRHRAWALALLLGWPGTQLPAAQDGSQSYSLGVQFAGNVRQTLPWVQFDAAAFADGVRDALGGKEFRLSTTVMSGLLRQFAQQPPPGPDPVPVPIQKDLSYTLGVRFSRDMFVHHSQITPAPFSAGVRDALSGAALRYSQQEIARQVEEYARNWQRHWIQLGTANREKEREFLAQNRKRPEIRELSGGVQYEVLQPGTSAETAAPGTEQAVTVHYRGTLLDGREFDSSYRQDKPVTLVLNHVIQGWRDALPLMPIGAKWRLYIPAERAYGEQGAPPDIGPNETLVFEIELLQVQ